MTFHPDFLVTCCFFFHYCMFMALRYCLLETLGAGFLTGYWHCHVGPQHSGYPLRWFYRWGVNNGAGAERISVWIIPWGTRKYLRGRYISGVQTADFSGNMQLGQCQWNWGYYYFRAKGSWILMKLGFSGRENDRGDAEKVRKEVRKFVLTLISCVQRHTWTAGIYSSQSYGGRGKSRLKYQVICSLVRAKLQAHTWELSPVSPSHGGEKEK